MSIEKFSELESVTEGIETILTGKKLEILQPLLEKIIDSMRNEGFNLKDFINALASYTHSKNHRSVTFFLEKAAMELIKPNNR